MIEENKKNRGRPKGKNTKKVLIPSNNGKTKNDTKFKHGHKLGMGRPAGSRNNATIALEQIGIDNAAAVYQKVVDLALEGDINACKIILDRVCPVRKGRNIALGFLGPIKTIQDANKLSEHITTIMIKGEISAEEAEDYGKCIDRRMKSIIDSDVMDKMNITMEKVNKVGK